MTISDCTFYNLTTEENSRSEKLHTIEPIGRFVLATANGKAVHCFESNLLVRERKSQRKKSVPSRCEANGARFYIYF
jgi:hypothetical protein